MPFPAGRCRKSPGLRRRPQPADFPRGFCTDDGAGEAGEDCAQGRREQQDATFSPGPGRLAAAAGYMGDLAELDAKSGAAGIVREYFLCALDSDFLGYGTGFVERRILDRNGVLADVPGFDAGVMVLDLMNCAGLMIVSDLDCGGKTLTGHTQGEDSCGNDFG